MFVIVSQPSALAIVASGISGRLPCATLVHSGHRFSKEVVLQNQGKHPVSLAWTNATFAGLKSKQSKAQKHAGKAKQVCCTCLHLYICMMWFCQLASQCLRMQVPSCPALV